MGAGAASRTARPLRERNHAHMRSEPTTAQSTPGSNRDAAAFGEVVVLAVPSGRIERRNTWRPSIATRRSPKARS